MRLDPVGSVLYAAVTICMRLSVELYLCLSTFDSARRDNMASKDEVSL